MAYSVGQIRFARTPEAVLCDVELSPWARCVYGYLAMQVWQGAVAKVGLRRIGTKLGFHRDTVSKAIEELAERGHLKVMGAGKARRSYLLVSPVFSQKQGQETVVVSAPSGARRMVSVDLDREKVG